MTDQEKLQAALEHLGNVLDLEEDGCRFDHHGGCQAHFWISDDWRATGCPYQQAIEFYKAATAPGREKESKDE